MSFQIENDEQSLAGASLIEQTVREIQAAYLSEKKRCRLTQQGLADRLGLKHRSVVNKWLLGKENLSLKTIGELAWALNKTAVIKFEDNSGGNFFNQTPQIMQEKPSVAVRQPDISVGSWGSTKPTYTPGKPVLEHA